jgi:hypothetical protein
MSNPSSFKEFQKEVLSATRHVDSDAKKNSRTSFIGGLIQRIVGSAVLGATFSSGLNERMDESYLEENYRSRFESHKKDPNYISRLIIEASKDIRKKFG